MFSVPLWIKCVSENCKLLQFVPIYIFTSFSELFFCASKEPDFLLKKSLSDVSACVYCKSLTSWDVTVSNHPVCVSGVITTSPQGFIKHGLCFDLPESFWTLWCGFLEPSRKLRVRSESSHGVKVRSLSQAGGERFSDVSFWAAGKQTLSLVEQKQRNQAFDTITRTGEIILVKSEVKDYMHKKQ